MATGPKTDESGAFEDNRPRLPLEARVRKTLVCTQIQLDTHPVQTYYYLVENIWKRLVRREWAYSGILIAAALWIGLTAWIAPKGDPGSSSAGQAGFQAPPFELTGLDGKTHRLSDYPGRVVVVNLWASWCPPCKAEMPTLQKIHHRYSDRGLVILGINVTYQDDLAAARRLVAENGLEFPILLDVDGETARNYGLHSLPTTVFIGRDGIVRETVIGGPLSEAALSVRIEQYLGEQ